jgi:hypothetical protein
MQSIAPCQQGNQLVAPAFQPKGNCRAIPHHRLNTIHVRAPDEHACFTSAWQAIMIMGRIHGVMSSDAVPSAILMILRRGCRLMLRTPFPVPWLIRRAPATPPQAADLSVQRLVESAVTALHPQGTDLVGPCPRHPDDGNPIVVHPGPNTWECPACNKRGGPVEWVMHSRRVSRTQAIYILGDAGPIPWPDDDNALLDTVVDYYHQTLLQDQEALDYLARRGLRDDHLIRHLRLGYANRTLGYRLPSRNSSAGQSIRKRLQGLGILRPTGHEHLSGSLVVPVLGADGRVVDLYGRKVSTKLRGGTPLHLFLHDSAPLPWLLDPTAASDTMIVTGSVMDALSWWTSGLHLVLVTPTMDPDLAGILAADGPLTISLNRSPGQTSSVSCCPKARTPTTFSRKDVTCRPLSAMPNGSLADQRRHPSLHPMTWISSHRGTRLSSSWVIAGGGFAACPRTRPPKP